MKKTTLLTFFIALTILFSAWTPAAASTGQAGTVAATAAASATLTITNPLPKATLVTLKGANNYTFTVSANQTIEKTIAKGSYRYKYQGCLGQTFSGILAYKNGEYTLDIKPCKMIKLKIVNPFFDTYSSTMKGWMNYQITVKPRHTETYSIVAGTYFLSYICTPSNKSWEGKVKLHKNMLWIMCE